MKKRVRVHWDYNSRDVTIYLGPTAQGLYDKWKESGADSDFDELADWIIEDVTQEVDIYIEGVEEA